MKTRSIIVSSLAVALALVTANGCGSDTPTGFGQPAGSSGASGTGSSGASGSGGLDFNLADASSDVKPKPIGLVTGKVVAPEGTIPISDALVYLTNTPPLDIPSGVYCDKCVELTSYAFTYSKPDGTFELPSYVTGDQYMVTQKSQFRRVRKITIASGTQAAPAADNRLPGKNDAALGDTIPKMKVMIANWDSIAKSLKKLGITELTDSGPLFDRTLEDVNEASKYHIIFVPCKGQSSPDVGGGGPSCSSIYTPSNSSKNAMREYVKRGGKLYATDWSYEYVRQIWPGFIKFYGETAQIGSACTLGSYSGPAVWNDPGLGAWMTAIGEGSAELKKSYVSISSVSPQPGTDENGAAVTITPKVWASTTVGANVLKSTVSFQDGCGRVMYSTYHAEGSDNGGTTGLLAQEKALFHILLEVSACVGVRPPPPPK
jgi:hypothetical protein